ncbi:hypothetical protein RND71_031292 [Anisodus tanguticus]|uniref:Uncharacterized protein n=1 Tax=Anisodus tanguticus TaxID=243964 RepID=A0AAE1RD30_9SOLA|nr:hypothetical protein RND71_031292 [Anisodus tanguticus]
MKSFRRTSSVNESLDRYNRLLDSCFYREEKHHVSDRSSFRASRSPSPARNSPIGLERILSMPDLRYYSSFKLEDSPEPGCSYTLDRAPSSNNLYVGISKSNEQKSLDIQTEEGYNSDSKVTIFLDVNENLDDFGGLKTGANSSSVENIIEGTSSVVPKLDISIPIPLPDMVFQNSTSGTAGLSAAKGSEEDAVNTDKKGFYASDLNKIHLQIQVGSRRHEAVTFRLLGKCISAAVLHHGVAAHRGRNISASANALASRRLLSRKWNSADQPINPSVFEEVEGYCLLDQDSGTCDQLHQDGESDMRDDCSRSSAQDIIIFLHEGIVGLEMAFLR